MRGDEGPEPERGQAIIRQLARRLVAARQEGTAGSDEHRRRIEALESQLAQAAEDRAVLQERLDAVYASQTWAAGAALLWLPKKLRGLRRRG